MLDDADQGLIAQAIVDAAPPAAVVVGRLVVPAESRILARKAAQLVSPDPQARLPFDLPIRAENETTRLNVRRFAGGIFNPPSLLTCAYPAVNVIAHFPKANGVVVIEHLVASAVLSTAGYFHVRSYRVTAGEAYNGVAFLSSSDDADIHFTDPRWNGGRGGVQAELLAGAGASGISIETARAKKGNPYPIRQVGSYIPSGGLYANFETPLLLAPEVLADGDQLQVQWDEGAVASFVSLSVSFSGYVVDLDAL